MAGRGPSTDGTWRRRRRCTRRSSCEPTDHDPAAAAGVPDRRCRRAQDGGGTVASGGASAGPGEPVAHPRRPVAGNGDPPLPVGRGLLGHRAGRGRPAGAVAPASRPHGSHPGPAALRARVRVPRGRRAGGVHAGRNRVAALLQPDGGAGRPVAAGAGAALGRHGARGAALQPAPAAQLGRAPTSCC